ncbi:uncharacterized protein N7529_000986 [Penicillium soppii]|uniref:uncharacterized protein n=1 Tax=Penicillium soppii TaxID=69789 RepID=UPI0025490761|nr:uncharacterized protein N7529_000986 [Penicillium soppii]KAJ5882314.1 hypothetical protein N7529_000986 [Penicillium soppii]
MEATDFDAVLRWGEDHDEFPDLQYNLGIDDTFPWDHLLDEYLDPFEHLDPFPLGALPPIDEIVEPLDALPELSPSQSPQCNIQMLSESITELKDRVNGLEDRYGTLSHLKRNPEPDYVRITEKQKRIADLEAYIESLQPFLLQLGTSIEGLLTETPK